MYLTDVLEMLDIDSFCVHNFLYNVGSHLILVFSYFLTMLANICILFFILDTTTIFWHFFLINSQLQPEQTKQTRVKQQTFTKCDITVTNFIQLREALLQKCSHSYLRERVPQQDLSHCTHCIFKYSVEISVWLNTWLSTRNI